MEDNWFILAAMPGWVYVDTGGSAEDAATLLQVISDDIIYGGVSRDHTLGGGVKAVCSHWTVEPRSGDRILQYIRWL